MFNSLNFPPYNHWQLSADHQCDGEYCLSAMLVDALTPLQKLYGDNEIENPQYLAENAHTTMQGSTIPNVDQAYYQDGLVSNSVLPELTTFTWNQLYGRDLSKIIPIGKRFWDRYDASKSLIQTINPAQAVAMSKSATLAAPYTIAVIVDLNDGKGTLNGQPAPLYHGQALLNGMIWDSYPTNPKPLSHPIIWAYKITLTPKNMSNVKLVKSGNEWGFFVPAGGSTPQLGETALIDKANNFGYPLAVLNNGANVDWPNVKPDLIATPNI